MAFFQASLLTSFLVGIGKLFAGRLRPNFNNLVTEINTERMSYPSGHTAYSFAVMVVFSLFFANQFQIFITNKRNPFVSIFVIFVIPFMMASTVAISRTRDYYHDFSDINAGCIIGLLSGSLSYYSTFPITGKYPTVPRALLYEIEKRESGMFEDCRTNLVSAERADKETINQ